MSVAYMAMASLAMLMADVAAARAQISPCDIYPDRCLYSGNGRYYFFAPGQHLPTSAVTPNASPRRYVKPATRKKTY
jgi:hypothetical protein